MTSALGVRRVRVPFRVPFETAAGTWAARESLIVEIRSEAGARGIGEAPIDAAHPTADLAALVQRLLDGPGEGVPEDVRHAFGAGLGGARARPRRRRPSPPPARSAPASRVNETIGAGSRRRDRRRRGGGGRGRVPTLKLKAGAREAARHARRPGAGRSRGRGAGRRAAPRRERLLGRSTRRTAAAPAPRAVGIQYVEQPLPSARAAARRGSGAASASRSRRTRPSPLPRRRGRWSSRGRRTCSSSSRRGSAGRGRWPRSRHSRPRTGVPVVVSSLFETGFGLAAAIACAAVLPDVPGWPAAERDHGLATAGVLEHDLLASPLVLEAGGSARRSTPARVGSGSSSMTRRSTGTGSTTHDLAARRPRGGARGDAAGRPRVIDGRRRCRGRGSRGRRTPSSARCTRAACARAIGWRSDAGVGRAHRGDHRAAPDGRRGCARFPAGSRPASGGGPRAARPGDRRRWRRLRLVPARARAAPEISPEAPAIVVLTSGTTGRPKGVVLSAPGAGRERRRLAPGPPAGTGWALPLGIGHVAGLGVLWRAIRDGVPIRILPPADARRAPRRSDDAAAQPRLAGSIPARPAARRGP